MFVNGEMGTMMPTKMVCLLFFNTMTSYTAASQPVIVASPPEIDVGLSDTLDVNCTVSVAGWSSVAALISLTVSRNNSQTGWTELAIISDFSNGQVNVMTAENLTSDGWFKASGSAASIRLQWDYPTDQQAGSYVCSAQGFDSVGHVLVSNTDVKVSAHSPGLSDIQDKLREMDIEMKQSRAKIDALELQVRELKKGKESSILEMFEASFEYKNHTYYVSRDAIYNVYVSLSICRIYGGYLTEIDDLDELKAIQIFLNSTSGFSRAFISGTDLGHEGTWALFSGKPLPFVHWSSQEPSDGYHENCLELYGSQTNWKMSNYYCHHEEPTTIRRFLCEVP